MYQNRASHALDQGSPKIPDDVVEAMWGIFVAIGDFWVLGDDPEPYRLRFQAFLTNRIALNPIYSNLYAAALRLVRELVKAHGKAKGYELLFTQKPRSGPVGPPQTELEFIQLYVTNEFISLRLALGSFKSFGAVNYCGYFGGANIEGQPTPYRTHE